MTFQAIIFDMDGTLTEPYIDWLDLRSKIDCPPEKTIIEHIESLPPDQAQHSNKILLQIEWEAAQEAPIREGAPELIDELRTRNLKLALVTNNHGAAMHCVIDRLGRSFDATFSRDDGPIKPEPYLIYKALTSLNVSASETISIGDSRYDLMACAAAKVKCIHLTNDSSEINHDLQIDMLDDMVSLLNTL